MKHETSNKPTDQLSQQGRVENENQGRLETADASLRGK